MNVLITGCNGFVGAALIEHMDFIPGLNVFGACRDNNYSARSKKNIIYINDLASFDDQSDILKSIDVIIHTAGKAHVMDKSNIDKQDYFEVNTHLTTELARLGASFGVKRFIFLSSIKVFGDSTSQDFCFKPDSPTIPTDAYGESKLEAERMLKIVAQETGIELVVIRPPIVYGPGVKGNMAMLTKLVKSHLPLPFRAISCNKRSMVSLENLADLIVNCLSNPNAIGQTFLVSDDHDLSTYEIICLLKKHFGSKSMVFSVPKSILYTIGHVTGLVSKVNRLVESSMVDIEQTKSTLNWTPPLSVDEAFEKMVK